LGSKVFKLEKLEVLRMDSSDRIEDLVLETEVCLVGSGIVAI
jgi:hypothetical protein